MGSMRLNGCFRKWWYPQIIHFNRVFHYIQLYTIHFGVPLFLETPKYTIHGCYWVFSKLFSYFFERSLKLPLSLSFLTRGLLSARGSSPESWGRQTTRKKKSRQDDWKLSLDLSECQRWSFPVIASPIVLTLKNGSPSIETNVYIDSHIQYHLPGKLLF